MYKVTVMMSSYNGEKYIAQQIDSILNQKDVDVQLIIRDDGSTDGTRNILSEYEKKFSNVKIHYGENIGYVKSFMWVANSISAENEMYYAFSDQDDVWDETKLCSAISLLQDNDGNNKPLMYYSDLKVVDENLNYIKRANVWEGKFDKYMSLMFIAVRGCTIVYNYAFHKIFTSKNTSEKISGHDTFAAALAFWTGKVIYDPNAYINYRQTGGNLSITGTGKLDALKKNIRYVKRRLTDKKNERENNAKALVNDYKEYLTNVEDVAKVANYKKSFKNKLALLKDKRFFNFHFTIKLTNAFLILVGKL